MGTKAAYIIIKYKNEKTTSCRKTHVNKRNK